MWTPENRSKYNRDKLRYPSDLTVAEWGAMEPLLPPAKRGGRRRSVDLREVVNGILYVLSTGCQGRAFPKDLQPRSTVNDYFGLWSWDGTIKGTSKNVAIWWASGRIVGVGDMTGVF